MTSKCSRIDRITAGYNKWPQPCVVLVMPFKLEVIHMKPQLASMPNGENGS